MTLGELKKKIAESTNAGWFQSRTLNLVNSQINYSISLKGFAGIYEYLLKQIKRFDEFPTVPDNLKSTKNRFNNIKNKILELVSKDTKDDYSWNNLTNEQRNQNNLIFPSDAPETEFLIRVNLEYPNSYKGAYDFFAGNNLPNDKNNLIGYLMSYEFVSKDYSAIVERKDAEKKSISRIRNDFQQQLSESEHHLIEYLAQAKQHADEHTEKVEELRQKKHQDFDGWFNKTYQEFNSFNDSSKQRANELIELYQEKLRLEAPAKYWNDRATKLRKEGYNWLCGLIGCIVVGIAIMVWVLNQIADGTLTQLFANTATAIKWSIGLITLISFIAYAIRVISKLTFSSFHLVRDAEEREQLTYVYLALQKEKGVDVTERHLIMQSLFSRADSGLLKDEASPTMPGNIMDKFISK